MTLLPTFIVIGAAKAGTTALYWYFTEHPEVFMSRVKETNYFAYVVDESGRLVYGNPDMHHFPVKTYNDYQALFADADAAQAIGEVSPLYLESPEAAARIKSRLPDAKIICCLRQPVERAYSDYLMYLRNRGRRFDPATELKADAEWARPESHWMKISRYHAQLARYFDIYPRDQLEIFLFDDLKRNPLEVTQKLYGLIGVDPSFRPDLETPHNVGGMPASRAVEKIFKTRLTRALQPWVPKSAADWIKRLRTRNMREAPPLPMELRSVLTSYFRDDILKTAELIGRSLDSWLQPVRR